MRKRKKYIKKYAIFQYNEEVVFKTQRVCGVGVVVKILHVNNEGEFIYHIQPLNKDFTVINQNIYSITCRESDLISKFFRRKSIKNGKTKNKRS